MSKENILNRFADQPITPEKLRICTMLHKIIVAHVTLVEDTLPDSREKALALTAFENYSMWIMKAVMMGPKEVKVKVKQEQPKKKVKIKKKKLNVNVAELE